LVAVLSVVLGVSAQAVAAGVKPKLLTPNHKHVSPGRIHLVVNIPLKASKNGVFIAISYKRKLDKFGHLKPCTGNRCDFVGPKHWKKHKYRYIAPFTFPGWAVTPGKYYWQVHYYT